ncbi:transportin-3 isoform X2 [Plodia interpunctella]|uniref:transportin-3 isoform X2 n=1 Tax=Plodia interpunctella TaxID=58824 RepID=UPI0023675032|nr:transportin-3 isoform X2 [Plodia interpunctella]
METPSMDTIYQAISALYDNPNANEKEKASRWLGDVQKSIHSWKIADQLLQQKKDVQSCYFAAQTMRSKVQHNLSELPSEAVVSLRDSLVAHLERTSPDTSSPILTQLCLALADLALQMPSWQNCISDLIKCFCNKNDFALLEILTVLPQEIDSSSLKLGENRRETIKSELRSHSQAVITFLKDSIVSSQNTHVALKIIKCMTSWIQVRAVNIQEVPNNAVIGFCMQVLRDHNSINTLHDAASDCICALLHCLEDNNNNEDVERLLFESVSGLEESYHMSVAHEEEEKAANYARVFTELAETFLEKIISTAMTGNIHFSIRSLELALVCVGHHDYEVAEITFNLWYRLSEDVYQNDYQPLTDTFKPHIERLIEALARHCQCEPDLPNLPDEDDEFFEFRMKVMGLIKDVVFIVGSSSVFRQMFTALQANISWEQTEAALFVMQSVAKNIVPEEYEYVPKVVEAILSMPDNTHIAVRKTCILLLGQLCEWIEQHPSGLLPSLQFLVRALQRPELAYAAATALQNICSACRRQASAHAPLLLEAHQMCDRLSLPLPHATALARATAATISTLPHHQLQEAMREATALQLRGLEELLQSEQPLRKGTRSDPVVWLDRLAALFRDVTLPTAAAAATTSATAHPCLPAALDAWPKLHQAMNKYISESRVMERLCRAVRFLLRCVGVAAAPLLPDLALVLHHVYSQHPHSCILYVASILVDELASIPECRAQLVALLQALMPRAFQLLQQENGLKDNPDTVDDLFRLCIRFLQRTPLELLAPGVLDGVLRCAALAAKLDHRDANSSVMKFLLDLVRATHHPNETVRALANEAIATYGEEMTCSLVEASVLHLHAYMVSEVAEVLVELAAWQRAHGRDWLRPAVLALPRAGAGHAQPRDAQCSHFHHYAIRSSDTLY